MELTNPNYLISASELAGRMTDTSLRIFDVTTYLKPSADGFAVVSGRDNYLKGHVPNAAFIDIQEELSDNDNPLRFSHLPAPELARAFASLGVNRDSEVIFYSSDHVMWATRAWWLLAYCGHPNVRVLDGGLQAWSDARQLIATKTSAYPAGDFQCENGVETMWADSADVLAAIGDTAVCTVNALPEAIYTGDAEISYGRAGHISGSSNLPYGRLLNDGQFADADILREQLSDEGLLEEASVITYCGGGIAATTTGFALKLFGKDNVAVYDGSMQDWASNPDNPITRGAER